MLPPCHAAYDKRKYMWKLLYTRLLGYDVDFGVKNASDLIAASGCAVHHAQLFFQATFLRPALQALMCMLHVLNLLASACCIVIRAGMLRSRSATSPAPSSSTRWALCRSMFLEDARQPACNQ